MSDAIGAAVTVALAFVMFLLGIGIGLSVVTGDDEYNCLRSGVVKVVDGVAQCTFEKTVEI